jgi:hypothetical protein
LSNRQAIVIGPMSRGQQLATSATNQAGRMTAFYLRRDKAALFQWVQGPPGDRSSRKQPGQAWVKA